MAGSDQPAGGDTAQPQPAPDQAPANSTAEPDKSKRPTGARPTSIEILRVPSGQKTLTINFRWSLYPKALVEVRLLPDPEGKGANAEAKGATVTPIYFSEQLTAKVRDDLYDCLDHPGEGGRTHSFTKDKIVYKMMGRRNSLGNQGVRVEVHREGTKGPGKHLGTVYLQLDTWAVDQESFSLDLARDEYAKPGTLFVWFFRGDRLVWDEQIRWPGYK